MQSQLNLQSISHYRTELMGLATLLIIVCHSTQGSFPIESTGIIRKLVIAGNYGVDIFLLLSGMGLFYSLIKVYEGEGSLRKWYERRFTRIFVPYFILVAPLLALCAFIDGQSINTFLWRASTFSYWTDHDGVWFLSLLVPLYLITPLYGWLARRYNLITGLMTILLWVCVISLGPSSYEMQHIDKTNVLINIGFCLIRLPSFFVGYWLAPYIRKAVCIPCWFAIGFPFIGIIIAHLYYIRLLSLNYLCSGLLIVAIAVCIMQKMGGSGLLHFMGVISLEFYLANHVMLLIVSYLPTTWFCHPIWNGGYLVYGWIAIGGTLVAWYVSRLSTIIIKELGTK